MSDLLRLRCILRGSEAANDKPKVFMPQMTVLGVIGEAKGALTYRPTRLLKIVAVTIEEFSCKA
jgi:hypothetical protein